MILDYMQKKYAAIMSDKQEKPTPNGLQSFLNSFSQKNSAQKLADIRKKKKEDIKKSYIKHFEPYLKIMEAKVFEDFRKKIETSPQSDEAKYVGYTFSEMYSMMFDQFKKADFLYIGLEERELRCFGTCYMTSNISQVHKELILQLVVKYLNKNGYYVYRSYEGLFIYTSFWSYFNRIMC